MKSTLFKTASFVFCLLAFPGLVNAQSPEIRVKFEVDGKELRKPFRIVLSVNDTTIEPIVTDKGFLLPSTLSDGNERMDVRFICDRYCLDYTGVYLSGFQGELIFGVDDEPFEEANLPTEPIPGKKLAGIHYITFEPDRGAATVHMVREFR